MPPAPSQDTFMNDLHGISWQDSLQSLSEDSSGVDHDPASLSNEGDPIWLQKSAEPRRAAGPTRKRRKQASTSPDKKRKTTYDSRREQKVEMTEQVEKLQKQLDELKYRVLVEKGEAARSNQRTAAGNAVLQEFIQ
ncbi:unnamed protein product [Phytophthora lilii]|uniref:Unnamed protein product n=1 Tax=Phytophthora lilii TaxID=2077276 RepID=A0A9W6XF16_9STRA|nr:unnamed protein product [Phytophthora lilii]